MRRALPLLLFALLLAGQAGVPPADVIVDADEPGSIRGVAWDPVAERAAAGVLISLFRPGRHGDRVYPEPWVRLPGEADEAVARLRSDGEGRFAFAGLEPGFYVVRARGVLQAGSLEVNLGPEEPAAEVRLSVETGASIRGVVLGPDARPLADFVVHVVGLDLGDGLNAAHDHGSTLHARTDGEGRYELAPLPTGTVWIQAAARSLGYSVATSHALRSGDRLEGVDIVVPDERGQLALPGQAHGGVGVRLAFGPEGPRIAGLIEGMPAGAAGLVEGDLVVELAGRPTRFMPPSEFNGRCRGPVGSEVTLKVQRASGEVVDFVLERTAFPE